jgi:hypothetical protein
MSSITTGIQAGSLILHALKCEIHHLMIRRTFLENSGENFQCPNCREPISGDDVYCTKCGMCLSPNSGELPDASTSEIQKPVEKVYQRRFSLVHRFLRLLISPSEAMKDIAFAPSYEGIVGIFIAEIVILIVSLDFILQKIEFSGPYADTAMTVLQNVSVLAIPFGLVLFLIRWGLKSWIIRYTCDSGSAWDFKSAASITGYAYLADVVIGTLGLVISWIMIPTIHIDTSNLDTLNQQLADYQAQLTWFKLIYTLPLSILGLLWKSYLGGLGAHFGTQMRCSLKHGMLVFFGLGSIGLLITLIL